jgi:chromosome segregation ATPase
MRARLFRRWGAALAALLVFGWGLAEVRSQQRRRPSRRATNPARTQPTPAPDAAEPALVSTADEEQEATTTRRAQGRARGNAAAEPTPDPLRGTVERLTTEVERLTGEVTSMKSDQRALFDLERLTRAEQRAEGLRAQLRDVTDKEFAYQERLAQIEDEIQPDSIQRRAAIVGTLNPGSVRDSIQRSLERERERLRRQLEMITNSRVRLEAAVSASELEVERLRQRVEGADQLQSNTATPPEATNTPAPTPTPAEPPNN